MKGRQPKPTVLSEADVLSQLSRWLNQGMSNHLSEKTKFDQVQKIYREKLYQTWIPALLKAKVSFESLDIKKLKKYLDFLEKTRTTNAEQIKLFEQRCEMIWEFFIAFGMKCGKTLENITDRMDEIYRHYPYPMQSQTQMRQELQTQIERVNRSFLDVKLRERVEHYANIYFYRLLKFYLDRSSFSQRQMSEEESDAEIISALERNPGVLKFANIRKEGHRFLESDQDRDMNDEIISGRTLFSKAAARKRPALSLQLLNIMEKKFGKEETGWIVRFPDSQVLRNLRVEACDIGDNQELFERLSAYDKQTLKDLSQKDKLQMVYHAIHNDCFNLLLYFKDQLGFDLKVLALKALVSNLEDKTNPSHAMVSFLLDQKVPVNVRFSQKNSRQDVYLFEHLLDPNRLLLKRPYHQYDRFGPKPENFAAFLDDNTVRIAITLIEHGADLALIQAHHKPTDIMALFHVALTIRSANLKADEHAVELGRIAHLQGLMYEKMGKSILAKDYYMKAGQYQNPQEKDKSKLENSTSNQVTELSGLMAQSFLARKKANFAANNKPTEVKKVESLKKK